MTSLDSSHVSEDMVTCLFFRDKLDISLEKGNFNVLPFMNHDYTPIQWKDTQIKELKGYATILQTKTTLIYDYNIKHFIKIVNAIKRKRIKREQIKIFMPTLDYDTTYANDFAPLLIVYDNIGFIIAPLSQEGWDNLKELKV